MQPMPGRKALRQPHRLPTLGFQDVLGQQPAPCQTAECERSARIGSRNVPHGRSAGDGSAMACNGGSACPCPRANLCAETLPAAERDRLNQCTSITPSCSVLRPALVGHAADENDTGSAGKVRRQPHSCGTISARSKPMPEHNARSPLMSVVERLQGSVVGYALSSWLV